MQYKRADIEGGVITDPAEIDYYKQVQNNDVLNNYMLGDFNEAGNYVISKEIVEELLRLIKVMQHTYDKTIFCISAKNLKDFGVLEFAVKITRDEAKPKEAVATLELLEPINKVGGYYQNINTVLIATYTDDYNADFLEKAYTAFNIISNADDYKGRKRLEDTAEEILARKEYLKALQRLTELSSEKTEEDYFNARVAALTKDGDVGKAILVRLQLETKKVRKLFLNPNSSSYYAKLNQLLDKVLEETQRNMSASLVEKLQSAQKVYVKDIQIKKEQALDDLFKSKTLPENMTIKQIETQRENKQQTAKPNVENKNRYNLDDRVIVADPNNVVKVGVKVKAENKESQKINVVVNDKNVSDDKTVVNIEEQKETYSDLFNKKRIFKAQDKVKNEQSKTDSQAMNDRTKKDEKVVDIKQDYNVLDESILK
jgi:hypothetical protein